jgi:hypothetical protein
MAAGKLDRGAFAGTLGAGDFLLFVNYDFSKAVWQSSQMYS